MFYFQGIQRLQLFFDSPNKLAVFLCMIIFLCFGSFLTLIKSSSQNCRRLSTLVEVMLHLLFALLYCFVLNQGNGACFWLPVGG